LPSAASPSSACIPLKRWRYATTTTAPRATPNQRVAKRMSNDPATAMSPVIGGEATARVSRKAILASATPRPPGSIDTEPISVESARIDVAAISSDQEPGRPRPIRTR
jgi:hypothetical protein